MFFLSEWSCTQKKNHLLSNVSSFLYKNGDQFFQLTTAMTFRTNNAKTVFVRTKPTEKTSSNQRNDWKNSWTKNIFGPTTFRRPSKNKGLKLCMSMRGFTPFPPREVPPPLALLFSWFYTNTLKIPPPPGSLVSLLHHTTPHCKKESRRIKNHKKILHNSNKHEWMLSQLSPSAGRTFLHCL